MKLCSFFLLVGLFLSIPISSLSQNDRLVVAGSDPTHGNDGIYLAYRLPGERFIDPNTGQAIGPEPFPAILGYTKVLNSSHILGVDLGWLRNPTTRLMDVNGNLVNVPVNTFQARFNYKFMPLGGDHLIEPYVGGAIVVGSTLSTQVQRLLAVNGNLQISAGARIFLGGPYFLQVEVPYSVANLSQWVTENGNNGINNTDFSLGSNLGRNQFWPVIGIGFEW